jgi:hypothetical protein
MDFLSMHQLAQCKIIPIDNGKKDSIGMSTIFSLQPTNQIPNFLLPPKLAFSKSR